MRYIKRRNPVTRDNELDREEREDRIGSVFNSIQRVSDSYTNLENNMIHLTSIIDKDSMNYKNDSLSRKFHIILNDIANNIELNAEGIIEDAMYALEKDNF